ncbi:hypothetical protein N0V91_001297 [Didymella pomorum]|uniref:Uncharacterized protein n=1 Tax=Didymella pomorum TaxID=749634 RepID=A0A9W8ZLA4_9PLEO|nr:hypothetical protein N0V91_001297 [Didymella pomorum]
MNGFAPLRPAQGPRAGVPAGFQQSQASEAVEPDKQRSSSSEDGQNKYHLKNPRRLQGDPFPGESSDDTQLQNVERIYHWTLRGAATSAQKKVWWGDVRMNVDEAHADMLKIYPGLCAHLNQACCPSDKVCRQKPEPPRSQASVSPDKVGMTKIPFFKTSRPPRRSHNPLSLQVTVLKASRLLPSSTKLLSGLMA